MLSKLGVSALRAVEGVGVIRGFGLFDGGVVVGIGNASASTHAATDYLVGSRKKRQADAGNQEDVARLVSKQMGG